MTSLFRDDIFYELDGFLPVCKVLLKLESYNAGGSIKIKTALALMESLERAGQLGPNRAVIESSSGNLGIALAILCARRGLPFYLRHRPELLVLCPADHRVVYGACLVVSKQRDLNGGFLQRRIDLVKEMCRSDARLVWPNQYANSANVAAHYNWTAPAIVRHHPDVTDIFSVGVGTAGTLMGCAKYIREYAPSVRIIPVDSGRLRCF